MSETKQNICIQCHKRFEQDTGFKNSYSDTEYYCSEECYEHSCLIDEHEKFQESEIVCPYCGYEHSDSWEYYDDEYDDFECDNCGRVFDMTRDITVTYTSTPHLDELLKMKEEEQ